MDLRKSESIMYPTGNGEVNTLFTGIIEEVGTIAAVKKGEVSSQMVIEGAKVLEGTQLGDSICTNGVCLTVTKMNGNQFEVDVMAETLRRSNLGDLSVGAQVNLERALTLQTRLGGHIVSGHIDGIGKISQMIREDNAVWVTVATTPEILKYVIEKGSIAIDGISLTVAYVDNQQFKVSIIPHTGEETTLLRKKVGEIVNLECDLIGKYVEKLLSFQEENTDASGQSRITSRFLAENGFL